MQTWTQTLSRRASENWRDAFASAVAACIAWVLSVRLLGHPTPIFAAITAIICLAPALPSRGQQAIGLLIGVATGIVVGELALLLPPMESLLRMGLATFAALLVASLFGLAPVVPIQAGISTVLLLSFGVEKAGVARMLDVLVGASVGLIFSQVLMTPNPVRLIDVAAKSLLRRLAKGFAQAEAAISERNRGKAEAATNLFTEAQSTLVNLDSGINRARSLVRWTLRGRFVAMQVREMAALYDRRAIRLYASALLFAESLEEALRTSEEPPPQGLLDRVAHVARVVAASAKDLDAMRAEVFAAPLPVSVPHGWQVCLDNFNAVEAALAAFIAIREE
ncbi:FUSC family protein [Rhodomicrobium sp. Az07]|uniref:FUSC family protein n=1 Tax=Rhodomicrobium sp. Az07 TaxID=2839034 RepID=UPI001BED2934|nr:FUSC family protein [Rhodomicrobium sp. Az07]MBT3071548.1 FUSC family protein [Rhodomicrobium sp. Az07]